MSLGSAKLPVVGTFNGVTQQGYINTALGAIATDFAGATEPTTANTDLSSLAGVTWHDTTNDIIYKRNEADTAWIKLCDVDETNSLAHFNVPRINAQVGTSYTFVAADRGRMVTFSNAAAIAVTLPQAAGDFGLKWYTLIRNLGAGLVTITPATSTIDAASTLTLPQYCSAFVYSDGTNYHTFGLTKITLLPQSIALTGVLSPSQVTGNQNNYSPTGLSTASVLRIDTDASRNFTGLAGGAVGRVVVWHNIGAYDQVLQHNVTSTAANRFYCPNSTDYTLKPNASVVLAYDATSSRWRVVDNVVNTSFTSSDQTITSAGALVIPHGLGAVPWSVAVDLVCQSDELNYVAGAVITDVYTHGANLATNTGCSIQKDATNLTVRFGSAATVWSMINATTGAISNLTNTNWKARFRARL